MTKIISLSVITFFLCVLPAGASGSSDNPFADLPKASDFLGSPEVFVETVEAKMMPVLGQFFGAITGVYGMAQGLKAFFRK
jgi:hypothetical protein